MIPEEGFSEGVLVMTTWGSKGSSWEIVYSMNKYRLRHKTSINFLPLNTFFPR